MKLSKHGVTFEDVLRVLTPQAGDAIVDALRSDDFFNDRNRVSLKSARLACRALRDLVDGSIRSIDLNVRRDDKLLLRNGHALPLARWPRCSEVNVSVDFSPQGKRPSYATVLALAFASLSPEVRHRIKSISLHLPQDLPGFALSVSSTLQCLPALESVRFAADLPKRRLEQQLLACSLMSLRNLRALSMPFGDMAYNVHTYAGSLRKLDLTLDHDGTMEPDAGMVSSILRLPQLEHLSITDMRDRALLHRLVQSLPPTFHTLELECCSVTGQENDCTESGVIRFRDGLVVAVEADAASFGRLAELIFCRAPAASGAAGRQPQHQPQHRLDSFRVDCLAFEGPHVDSGPEAVRLRALLQRCACVEVELLRLAAAVSVDWALSVLPLLGGFRMLDLDVAGPAGNHPTITIRTASVKQPQCGAAAAAATGASAAGASGTEASIPSPRPSLFMLALDAVVAAGAAGAHPQGSFQQRAKPAASADGKGRGGPRHLMLRGPLLAGLVSDPPALQAWLLQLAERTGAEGPGAEGPPEPSRQSAVSSYMPLSLPSPHSEEEGAVIVECATAADAAAVQAAAAATAAGPQTSSAEVVASSALADMQEQALYRISALSTRWHLAVQQAAQDVWDGVGPSDAWSRAQRLRWLLEEWAAVRAWPEEVRV